MTSDREASQDGAVLYIVCGPSIWYDEDLDWFRIERGVGVVVATHHRDHAEESAEGYVETLSGQYSLDDVLPRDTEGVLSIEELVAKNTTITEIRNASLEQQLYVVCGPRGIRNKRSGGGFEGSSVWGVCEHSEVLDYIRRGRDTLIAVMRSSGYGEESVRWEIRGLGARIVVEKLSVTEPLQDICEEKP
jgi:hypothetical protein